MSIFKIDKTKDFTVMSNYHLRDRNLSLKAKGLLSFMLSLPDDWDYSLRGLVAICKESKDAIRSTLDESKLHNYLIIESTRDKNGKFEYNYHIYEKPFKICFKTPNTPNTDNPYVDEPNMDNKPQINTNIQNINKNIDKDLSSFFIGEEHNVLTLELIDRGYIDEKDIQIYYYDKLFEDLLNNNSYKDIIYILHYIIPRVLERSFKDEYGNIITNKFGYLKSAIISNINKLNIEVNSLWDCDDQM